MKGLEAYQHRYEEKVEMLRSEIHTLMSCTLSFQTGRRCVLRLKAFAKAVAELESLRKELTEAQAVPDVVESLKKVNVKLSKAYIRHGKECVALFATKISNHTIIPSRHVQPVPDCWLSPLEELA
ncbi:hypothetical protein ACFE04_021805 [Oxalis oulophora]